MTKTRTHSVDGALTLIAGTLPGAWEQMAQITGYHERPVRGWGDPDREEQINLPAAIKLDLAFQAEGGAGQPLYDAYGYLVGLAREDRFCGLFDILRAAIDVVREMGDAKTALMEAALPDATDEDRRDAKREMLEAIEAMKRAMLRLEPKPRIITPP